MQDNSVMPMGTLVDLMNGLNYQFINTHLLITALTHKSFYNECVEKTKLEHNERLEFLGDALLESVVTMELFERFKNASEGELSKLRSSLVNEASLCELALYLQLDKYIKLGVGEQKNDGSRKPSILSNTFEAVLGAVFLDSSHGKLVDVFKQLISRYEAENGVSFYSLEKLKSFDSKTKLQEICHKLYQKAPKYVDRCLDDHQTQFEVRLLINENEIACMQGHSKKILQQKLAQYVLENKLYQTRL
jgi:ribonuclease-3